MTTQPTVNTVYITKWALAKGILIREATQSADDLDRVKLEWVYLDRPDWHTDLPSARARVREMVAAKVESLRKSLSAMEKLAAEYKD